MALKRYIVLLILLLNGAVGITQDTDHPVGNYEFFENKGQWPTGVLYNAHTGAGNVWLEQGRVLYHFLDYSAAHEAHATANLIETNEPLEFKQDIIAANFVNANLNVTTTTKYPTTNYQNYFLGNDKSHWASGVYGYSHITYNKLYEGVDLLFLEDEGMLKYEFHVMPNADPSQIQIQYDGYEKIKISRDGALIVYSDLGEIQEEKPYAYQIKNGKVIEIPCEFKLDNGTVAYELGTYDENLELIIDPVLIFATYCGSVTDNFGMTGTYAYDGKGYSAGMVFGNAYPTPGPAWNTTPNITVASTGTTTTDVFVSKYNENGSSMIWTNFIGGGDNTQGTETAHSLICDTDNNLYMYGVTSSTDFPIEGGFQTEHAGGNNLVFNSTGTNFGSVGTDIYLAKFSSDGLNLMASTYIGGSGNDGVNYKVTSGTYAGATAYDSLTTNYGDQFRGEIMLDSLNEVYITSSTRSTDFPTVSPFQAANGGQQDAVVFKVSADFSELLWSSYYGGSENDAGYSVKLDSSYNVVFGGGTSSSDLIETAGGVQPVYNGGKADGFVTKLIPAGTAITQSTYVGTPSYDQVFFIEVDRWDNIYIVGQSLGDMPVSADVYSNPGSSQFIWKLAPTLASTEYTTVFGDGTPQINISPSAFLVDVCGNVYVSGWGGNILVTDAETDLPTTADAFQETALGGYNFYMIVLEREAQSLLYATYMGGATSREHVDGGTSRFDKLGVVYQSVCGGCGGNSDFPTTDDAWSDTNDAGNCNNLLYKFDFEIIPVAKFEVDVLEGCAPLTLEFDNESNDTTNFTWEFGDGADVISGGVSPVVLFDEPGTYEVTLTILDTICNLTDTAVKIITVYPELQFEVPNDTVVCDAFSYDLLANSFGTATAFQWSTDIDFGTLLNDGPTDSIITVSPTTTTTYYATVTNGWPLCDIVDSVVVTFVAGAIEIIPDTAICLADTIQLYANNLLPDVEIDYDWAPNEFIITEVGSSAWALPPTSMYFYLTAVTDLGCIIYDSVWVSVQSIDESTIAATATPNVVAAGTTTTLQAFPASGFEYLWFPPFGLDDPTAQTTTANVDETTTYKVFLTDGVCTTETSVTVSTYEFVCGDVYIFVPSAFSPNGDNQNDQLFVRGLNITEIRLKIFDRWGELVFETTDQSVGWDGRYKGKKVDPDVYVYHLTAICFDGQENLIKGNVTVLQ